MQAWVESTERARINRAKERVQDQKPARRTCFHCNERCHLAVDCPQRSKSKGSADKSAKGEGKSKGKEKGKKGDKKVQKARTKANAQQSFRSNPDRKPVGSGLSLTSRMADAFQCVSSPPCQLILSSRAKVLMSMTFGLSTPEPLAPSFLRAL